ncbi:MAG: hypothetical protein V3V14_10655 [Saprospiraceae bacterium]
MASILHDIYKADAWLVKTLKKIGHDMDHSIESIQILEDLISAEIENGEPLPNGFFSKHYGWKVFCFSSYIGETIIQITDSAKWNTNDTDPQGEIEIELESANGMRMWPGQRVLKRIMEGEENNLFHYTQYAIKNMQQDSDVPQDYRRRIIAKPKPWWKFW